jgi:AraC-like DNA-binding protein
MEDYNKIIESLSIRYLKAKHFRVLEPVAVDNYYDVENTILYLRSGQCSFNGGEVVNEGEALFIPGGKTTSFVFGSNPSLRIHNEDFLTNREKYLQPISAEEAQSSQGLVFTQVSFEAKVFDSVNFFASLDVPAFSLSENPVIYEIIDDISREAGSKKPGKDRIVKISTDMLVVEVIRHILDRKLFVEQLATNSTYFNDPRLIDIFTYIKENISGDLSNKVLANVANVSEDYVGQYFKMLTGINPQDYIEYQRMEKAVTLLRTSKKSIREIGKEVGYKDTAYFCRRFKMMFGIPAGKMRRRESLMNV